MKVLVNCLSAVSGGAVTYLRNLIPLLHNQFNLSAGAHELIALVHESQRDLWDDPLDIQFVTIRGARPVGASRLLWEKVNLRRIVNKMHIDVVFIPYQIGAPVSNAKLVLMLRNMEPFLHWRYPYSLKSRIRNIVLQRKAHASLRKADRVIAVSDFAQEYAARGVGIESGNLRTICHGRDGRYSAQEVENDIDTLSRLGITEDYVFTCGSILPYRRCEDIIAAFGRSIAQTSENAMLVIAGTGTDVRYASLLESCIDQSGQAHRIKMLGHVSQDDMSVLYRQSRIFVTATEIEACPNVAIEAMASGCAIVAADNSPLPEMFSQCAIMFRPRDIDDMAIAMGKLWDDGDLRGLLSKAACLRAQYFSWKRCAEETYDALTSW